MLKENFKEKMTNNEDGGIHLTIPFWHLLMNLKNFNLITNKVLFKKKNISRYHYQSLHDVMHSSWGIEQNILKLMILGHFLPFYHPLQLKNSKSTFWKMKKFAGNIIILQIWTINENHVMYGSWDMNRDEDNFLSF